MKCLIYAGLFLSIIPLYCREYVYPVAAASDHEAYVLYQKSPAHIELWRWDLQTQHAERCLLSRFTPAGFTLLPNNAGFSFVDNGIIKVQHFDKRSPATLYFDEPVYDANIIRWRDPKTCYFSAKKHGINMLFQMQIKGFSTLLCVSPSGSSYLYPDIYDHRMFFIERRCLGAKHEGYRILTVPYPHLINNQPAVSHKAVRLVVDWGMQPIAFLHMASDTDGFVVEHPPKIDRTQKTIPFTYCHFYRKNRKWERVELFTFHIPTALLSDSYDRLHESILPFLPHHIGQNIYYTSAHGISGQATQVYQYNKANDTTSVLDSALKIDDDQFCPILVGTTLVWGGALCDRIRLYQDEFGYACINLPHIKRVVYENEKNFTH